MQYCSFSLMYLKYHLFSVDLICKNTINLLSMFVLNENEQNISVITDDHSFVLISLLLNRTVIF